MDSRMRDRIKDYISINLTVNSGKDGDSKKNLYVVKGQLYSIKPKGEKHAFPFSISADNGYVYDCLLSTNSILYKAFVNDENMNRDLVFVILSTSLCASSARVCFISKYTDEVFAVCKDVVDEISDGRNKSDRSGEKVVSLRSDKEIENKISSLPAHLQDDARLQLGSSCFTVSKSAAKERTEQDLGRIYTACRTSYPESTQQRIDAIMSGAVTDPKKCLRKILSVSTGYTPEKISLKLLSKGLNDEVMLREHEIKCIIDTIRTAQMRNRSPRILLIGPDGCGKRTIAHKLAELRHKPVVTVPFYSMQSLVDFAGCSSVFENSTPGPFYKKLQATGTTDVTAIMEGIDACAHDDFKNGDPDAGLLGTLNGLYYDTFLEAEFDVSRTYIICTANDETKIKPKIKECFDAIVYLNGYTDEERFIIAKKCTIPSILSELPADVSSTIHIDDSSLRYIIGNFCYDSGMTLVESSLNAIVGCLINDSGARLTKELIDECLNAENLSVNRIATVHMSRDYFDAESGKIIDKIIVESKSEGNRTGRKSVAEKQLEYLYDIVKKRDSADSEFKFSFDSFIAKVDKSHSGMEDIKLGMARQFNRLARTGKGGNLLLVGPPGQGKTTLSRSAAKAAGLPFFKISCNGISDPSYFKGTLSAVTMGSCGIITKALGVVGRRGVIVLDEIDKLTASGNAGYSVVSSLLDLLDERRFADSYLDGVRLDLSEIIFIATANYIENIPPEIINRFETVRMRPYSKKVQAQILRDFILPEVCCENKCKGISFTDEAIDFLINNYYFSTGARQIKVFASKIVETVLLTNESAVVTSDDIVRIIGAPTADNHIRKYDYSMPGRVNGLAVSSYTGRGSISIIDCIKTDGTSVFTGMVQGSCLESITVAKAAASTINPECASNNYHIHMGVGEASVAKDGSSGGVALTMAILSCCSGTPVDKECCFTGEVDIFGNVYEVGGVPEKIRAGIDSGCTKIFIPRRNYEQLTAEELEEFDAEAEVIAVNKISDVISRAFPFSVHINKQAS